jgi:hypothetical protein
VFTFMHLWARPYWDLVEYHVMLRWQDDGAAAPVDLEKDGTLQVPGDSTPEEILLALAEHLRRQAVAAGAQRHARVNGTV